MRQVSCELYLIKISELCKRRSSVPSSAIQKLNAYLDINFDTQYTPFSPVTHVHLFLKAA